VNCADSFVANQSVKKYFPTREEYEQIWLKIKDEETTPEIEEWLDSNKERVSTFIAPLGESKQ